MAKITIEIDCDCPYCVHAVNVAVRSHQRQRRSEPSALASSYVFGTYNVEGKGLKEVVAGMEREWRRQASRYAREQRLALKHGDDTAERPCRHGRDKFRHAVLAQAERLRLDEDNGRSRRGTAKPSRAADDLMDQAGGLEAADAGSSLGDAQP